LSDRRALQLIVALTALAVGWLALFQAQTRAVTVADAPAGKVDCLSYTPRGMIPGPTAQVFPETIDADLALLATETRCIRTYSSTQGMAEVPVIARRHGLTVMLGIWIGRDEAYNEQELATGLAAANAHPDVVRAVVVGNEVLLRHEQDVAGLRRYLERANAATDVPVTYADVWEFWRRGATLADAVDFITIHILPYWENNPVGVEAALQHVKDVFAEMQAEFPAHRLVIGETGWPTKGRPREAAYPSTVAAATFVRSFAGWAAEKGIDYNLIEAFDQPWKRGLEGTVGGYWGLFGIDGKAKFPLQGPVTERDDIGSVLVITLAFGAIVAVLAFVFLDLRRPLALGFMAASGLALGASAAAFFDYVPHAARSSMEWAQYVIAAGVCTALVSGLALRAANLIEQRATAVNPTPSVAALRMVFLFGLAYACLGLVLDGRYRDFPVALIVLPALLLIALRDYQAISLKLRPEERTLCGVIACCAAAGLGIEGLENVRALVWNGACLGLTLSLLAHHRAQPAEDEHRSKQTRPSGFEAVQHAPHQPAHEPEPGKRFDTAPKGEERG